MEKVCKVCGATLSQFYKSSMLGCENCYAAFSAELVQVLDKIQGRRVHVGKKPKVGGVDREMLFEYKRLLALKEESVLEGRFDEADELAAEIKQLALELSRRGLR